MSAKEVFHPQDIIEGKKTIQLGGGEFTFLKSYHH